MTLVKKKKKEKYGRVVPNLEVVVYFIYISVYILEVGLRMSIDVESQQQQQQSVTKMI